VALHGGGLLMGDTELRPLVFDDLEPVIELHRQTGYPEVPQDAFRRAYMETLRTRWARGHIQVLGYFHRSRLMASFRLHRLEMLINGVKRNCAGVGAVLTLPEGRDGGHTGQMLRDALERFRSQYSICTLFSTTGPRFYKSLGFFPLPNLKYVLVRNDAKGAHDGHGRADEEPEVDERLKAEARAYVPADLPELVQVYNLDVSLRKIGILRSEAYWEHLFETDRIHQHLAVLANADDSRRAGELRTYLCHAHDRTASYVTVRVRRDRMQVLEVPAESARFQSWMLRYALSVSQTEQIPRVESQVPLRAGEGEVRVLVRRDTPLMMLHPLDSGLTADDFPYPTENFLWSRDRF